eukprot:gene25125-biopygen19479
MQLASHFFGKHTDGVLDRLCGIAKKNKHQEAGSVRQQRVIIDSNSGLFVAICAQTHDGGNYLGRHLTEDPARQAIHALWGPAQHPGLTGVRPEVERKVITERPGIDPISRNAAVAMTMLRMLLTNVTPGPLMFMAVWIRTGP